MKLEVGRNELFGALQAVIGVVERRQTLPVLSNLFLQASEGELILTGTDLELERLLEEAARGVEDGAIHQPAGVVRLHHLARLRIRLPIARLGRLDRDAHERRRRRPRRDSRRGGWRDQPHGRRDQRAGGDEEGEHGSAEREVSTRCAKLRIQ